MHFDKTSPKKRKPHQQKISRSAIKKQPTCAGKPPTVNTAHYKTTWLAAISSHVSLHCLARYLRSTASSNMLRNAYYRNFKRTMLVLRNKDQRQKNPLPFNAMEH